MAKHARMIEIPSIRLGVMRVEIKGRSDLIVHAWSEKAKNEMRIKQQKKAKPAKEAKDPNADFEASKYKDAAGRDCIKALAIKSAMVSAAGLTDGLKMTFLRKALFVRYSAEETELIPLSYETCEMREDMVRVGMGTADLRYRAAYKNWSAAFEVEWQADVLEPAQVLYLLRLAGFSIGIHEWRPERDGDFGRFDLASAEAVSIPSDTDKAPTNGKSKPQVAEAAA